MNVSHTATGRGRPRAAGGTRDTRARTTVGVSAEPVQDHRDGPTWKVADNVADVRGNIWAVDNSPVPGSVVTIVLST